MKTLSLKEIIYILINSSFVFFILVSLGITKFAPKYLFYTREFLKIYIGFLLIILYNPIIKIFNKKDILDNKILFNIGLLLILSSIFYSSIEYNMRLLLDIKY
tara:strand:+ start:3407 stop:3715 length:309 start_codon:yes stop_codon:yes gene_type:complete